MDNEETAVSPLLAKLREEKAELTARIAATEDGNEIWHLTRSIVTLTERIEDVEKGTPTCRHCGSKHIVAWYLVDERQGLIIERAEDGSLEYDYDGDTSSGEPGADYEYRCRGCETVTRSLEYLVGDTDEDEPDDPTIEVLRKSCGYSPDEEGSVDALIAYKDALEDAYTSLLSKARS